MAAVEGYRLAMSNVADTVTAADLTGLVETYAPLLFRVAHSVLRNAAEAEDIVQDTFVRVLEHQATLPAVRDMRVWLVRIAWRLAVDRRRRIRPDQLDAAFAQTVAGSSTPADQVLAKARELTSTLAAIDKLPRKEREALLLSTVDELTASEVAAVLRCTDSAVRALVFRARTHLRTTLARQHRSTQKGARA